MLASSTQFGRKVFVSLCILCFAVFLSPKMVLVDGDTKGKNFCWLTKTVILYHTNPITNPNTNPITRYLSSNVLSSYHKLQLYLTHFLLLSSIYFEFCLITFWMIRRVPPCICYSVDLSSCVNVPSCYLSVYVTHEIKLWHFKCNNYRLPFQILTHLYGNVRISDMSF